jgi:hypothetical protein
MPGSSHQISLYLPLNYWAHNSLKGANNRRVDRSDMYCVVHFT